MSSDVHPKWMNSAAALTSAFAAKRSRSQYSTALTSWLVSASIALMRSASATEKSAAVTISSLEDAPIQALTRAVDIQIVKDVPWQKVAGNAEPPAQQYAGPDAATLSCELIYDGSATGQNVATATQPLQMLAQINQVLGRPPRVLFKTGAISFKGVIDQVAIHYTHVENDSAVVVIITVKN